MTRREAEAVARAVGFADNGCDVCAGKICAHLSAANLGYTFLISTDQTWRDEIDDDVDDPRDFGWINIVATAAAEDSSK